MAKKPPAALEQAAPSPTNTAAISKSAHVANMLDSTATAALPKSAMMSKSAGPPPPASEGSPQNATAESGISGFSVAKSKFPAPAPAPAPSGFSSEQQQQQQQHQQQQQQHQQQQQQHQHQQFPAPAPAAAKAASSAPTPPWLQQQPASAASTAPAATSQAPTQAKAQAPSAAPWLAMAKAAAAAPAAATEGAKDEKSHGQNRAADIAKTAELHKLHLQQFLKGKPQDPSPSQGFGPEPGGAAPWKRKQEPAAAEEPGMPPWKRGGAAAAHGQAGPVAGQSPVEESAAPWKGFRAQVMAQAQSASKAAGASPPWSRFSGPEAGNAAPAPPARACACGEDRAICSVCNRGWAQTGGAPPPQAAPAFKAPAAPWQQGPPGGGKGFGRPATSPQEPASAMSGLKGLLSRFSGK
eukprot:TRINITY_DN10160_c0_g3_i1.p1 TRINITY_DN10160_c0_g3~~TRINITY_DN10160_c0_g3_i1.p1  ORF type:complete len:482 (+),score=204.47 TRINITY_DN10160_c0_g3_i1:217-1446(+)